MKKFLVLLFTVTMILGAEAAALAGAEGRRFADQNRNGICDHQSGVCRFTDEDGNGVCGSQSAAAGRRKRDCGFCRVGAAASAL